MVRGQTPQEPTDIVGSPRRLGRYTLFESFAVGGTSELYVALRDGSRDICLLKVLSPQLKADARAMQRIQREAAVAFRLTHPNFARLLSAGDEGGRFTLASEFIAGQSLAGILGACADKGLKVPVDVALAVTLQVLDGLHYLHEQKGEDGQPLGLVHRDLTVANVLLSFAGEVKIIDLGAMHGRLDDFKTAPGVAIGTPQAMAPEQAVGGEVDRRTDVYAAGLLLYQLLTGTMPFAADSLVDTLSNVRSRVAPPASSLRPEVPAAISDALARALAKDPAARPATAAELRALLAAAKVPPASRDAMAAFVRKLAPEELARMEALVSRGREHGESVAEFESEESLAQAAFTKAGVPIPGEDFGDEASVRTAIVRNRSSATDAAVPMATVIPLPRKGERKGKSSEPPSPAHTPTGMMEMPGTAVVKVSNTQLVRDTRALRGEVERWRYAFVAAVAAGVAGMALVGVVVLRYSSASTPAVVVEPPSPVQPAPVGAAVGVVPSVPVASAAPPSPAPSSPAPTSAKPELGKAQPVRSKAPVKAPGDAPEAPAATPSPEPPKEDEELKALRRAFTQLRAEEPRDAKAFDALVARVRKAAEGAEPAKRKLVLSDVAAAERSFDVEPLGEAIKKLER